jgi:L-alanine-DL-glutamate epimerase-like enolase superfamily enzyme
MRVRLYRAALGYGGGLVLHTASSGSVPALDELYLRLVDRHAEGLGEVRINIAYLNGLPAEAVIADAVSAVERADWTRDPADLLAGMEAWTAGRTAPVRALIDAALHDYLGRRAHRSVAALLGAPEGGPIEARTNQTLFVSEDAAFRDRAERYVARGFRDLKVRIGAGDVADDLARLAWLRRRFGDGVRLAADVNGRWTLAQARDNVARLLPYGLAYLEQPLPTGENEASARLAADHGLPIMLDESVATAADVEAVIAAGGRLWAHLKLVKLGGIAPTLAAARRLRAAGIPFMIGQMNEGAGATAAALQAACAAAPDFAELYGADGLLADPVSGLAYRDGTVAAAGPAGLGITFDAARARLIRDF